MMDLSFRWPHPRFDTPIGSVSVRLHTFDNAFGIDPDAVTIERHPDGSLDVDSPSLAWAGGQRKADGSLSLRVEEHDGEHRFTVTGRHADGIRSIALTIHDLPRADVDGTREGSLTVGDRGRIVRYPNGWFDLATPYVALADGDASRSIRSLDDDVQPKTFAFIPHFDDPTLMDVELIVEAAALTAGTTFTAPAWAISRSVDTTPAAVAHRAHVLAAYGETTWEDRADVPEWTRDVSLVATLHGQHFTGRTFLDYEGMLDAIRSITRQIDGHRVLAYLPGWEGRYYRWYGRYGAESTLGGSDGFRRLVDGARELGVHVMPMFGANVASRDVPGFERWGEPGILRRRSGLSDGGSVDWDGSRHYDYGGGALINPAHQPWRTHLVEQVAELQHEYGFDATFLDITAMYGNDPNGDTTEGLRALVSELHAEMPGHLIAGEGWFDALGSIIPLVQTGHLENVPVFHDLPDEELFTRTNRSFGHVCLGDPAFHSSGVHEAGYVKAWRLPVRRGVIPTIGVVDGTMHAAPDRVTQIVGDAHEYADRFLLRIAASS